MDELSFAKKITISLVKSPLYSEPEAGLDKELKLFFNSTRQLRVDDHFSIKSLFEDGREFDLASFYIKFFVCLKSKPGKFYQFKLIQVEPEFEGEFLANNIRTTLVQTQSAIKEHWIWPEL